MNQSINKYFFILALVFLSACKVSKDVATPDTGLPVTFRNAGQATDSAGIADLPWQSFFTDATLKQLIGKALEQNYDMQLALKNIEAAQLQLKQTKWGYVPDARIQAGASTSRPSDNSLNGLSLGQFLGTRHIEDYSASLVLSWEADIWGKIRNQQKAALAAYLQTGEARKLVQTDIVAGVSKGYYNLLMLDAQLDVARRNLALNDSTLRMIRLQFDAGQVTSLAVQQAEAQRLEAAQLVPQFEQNITIQENALSILAGELPAELKHSSGLQNVAFPENPGTGLPSALLSRRPDVRSTELQLDIANARVGIAKANMYPTLSITANGGVNAFKASNWFNIPASLFGTVAGNLAQPLIQKKQLRTQYQLAGVEREKAVLQFRQSVLAAVGEVSDALVKIDKLKSQYAIANARVATLQQAISNASLLFQNGMATYLEVITAQGNVLKSELEISMLKRDQLNAVVDLYRSLGGGWK
ncbi:TolC family protein [Taibaiella chishuiensis]|nr:TolC family protein [Taibaiella chishuiensis]